MSEYPARSSGLWHPPTIPEYSTVPPFLAPTHARTTSTLFIASRRQQTPSKRNRDIDVSFSLPSTSYSAAFSPFLFLPGTSVTDLRRIHTPSHRHCPYSTSRVFQVNFSGS